MKIKEESIHNWLNKTSTRLVMLLIPFLFINIGCVLTVSRMIKEFQVPSFTTPVFFISLAWLIIMMCIFKWNDKKK